MFIFMNGLFLDCLSEVASFDDNLGINAEARVIGDKEKVNGNLK